MLMRYFPYAFPLCGVVSGRIQLQPKADVTEMSGHSNSLQFAFAILSEAEPRNTEMMTPKNSDPSVLSLVQADPASKTSHPGYFW